MNSAQSLEGQYHIPLQVPHKAPVSPSGTKEELGIALAKLLRKYDAKPSSELWIDIQMTAREILK